MKKLIIAIGLAAGCAGCVPTFHETLAVACTDHIGRPISERIAALGPPKTIYKISATRLGYVFEASETTLHGGDVFYTVNYLVGADRHVTPIYPVTTTCRGFVVDTPTAATPTSQRIIVDVL